MPRGEPKEGAIARGAGIGATMRGVCAWCGKELRAGQGAEALETTHGICEECYLDLRVKETLRRLWEGTGPFTLFVPPNRVDVVMRLWREGPPDCLFVARPDRRKGDRRTRKISVAAERRRGRDRRQANLSLLAATWPTA